MSHGKDGHKRAERFELSAARNTAVFICSRVRDGAPVLHVSHDRILNDLGERIKVGENLPIGEPISEIPHRRRRCGRASPDFVAKKDPATPAGHRQL